MNGTIESIGPRRAREHLESNSDILLICAYDDDEQFEQNHLKGAISLGAFRSRALTLSKEREIIFYCACPQDETSTARAEEYEARGFSNVKVLSGGVYAWKAAGYPVILAEK